MVLSIIERIINLNYGANYNSYFLLPDITHVLVNIGKIVLLYTTKKIDKLRERYIERDGWASTVAGD